jgi:hypothetical protein
VNALVEDRRVTSGGDWCHRDETGNGIWKLLKKNILEGSSPPTEHNIAGSNLARV